MCGVSGIFHYAEPERPIDMALLRHMTRLLAHRGPDDEGFHVRGPIGLGHRRLAIVDLTATGRQPMASADGTAWLSYNGEFYNHMDYRAGLEGHGFRFRGRSDTETLLNLLVHAGPHALANAAGIFAFAFWDAREQRLLLMRDPLGVKQLYYYDDGRRILFASEIKALLACPDMPRDIDYEAANQYLHFHTPLFDRTFFRAIKQVRAGEYIEVRASGVQARRYWHLDGFAPRTGSTADQVLELRQTMAQVVQDQLQSDVPVGAFFSGGIDSCAIATFAKNAGTPLRCFGVHFEHPDVIDERPYQEAAAKALDLPLTLMTVDANQLPEDLLQLTYFQDQPVIGPAMLPMYHVSRLAAGQVKVCLGGQAADEVFAGYARYALAHPSHVMLSMLAGARPSARLPGAAGSTHIGGNLLKQLFSWRNMRRLAHSALLPTAAARYFDNFVLLRESAWHALSADPAWINRRAAWQIFNDTLADSPAHDMGDKLLHWDMQTYLTGLFQQDDRMSMAHSLESRVPFADPRMVRFAFHTPFDLKLRGGSTKWILRQAMVNDVPPAVLSRRKVGFDTPMAAWFRGPHLGFVRDLLTSQRARERGLWNPKQVEALLGNLRHPQWFDVVWKLVSIEAWATTFVDAVAPAQMQTPWRMAGSG